MNRGFTLLEMVVTVFVLSLLASMGALAVRSLRSPDSAVELGAIEQVRAHAIETGRAATWISDSLAVRFEPSGSSTGGRVAIPGAGVMVIDPITGRIRAAK